MAFRRVPSAASQKPDPVEFEAYAHLASHRRSQDHGLEDDRNLQILKQARTRDMRVLLNLRHKTATVSKGSTTTNKIENNMQTRAEESAHLAAEHHIKQLKRRLASHAVDYFARADKDWSGKIDINEWIEAFGSSDTTNPLWNAGDISQGVLLKAFKEMDIDGDGEVSIYEFVTGLEGPAVEKSHSCAKLRSPPKSASGKGKSQSPQPLESPLARYRRRNRPATMQVPDLMKIVTTCRQRGNRNKSSDDDDDEADGGGGFLDLIGVDAGGMEKEDLQAQIRNVFELFDDDESGFLDFLEIKDGLQRFGVTMPDHALVALVEKVGAGTTMECNAAQFEHLLSMVRKVDTPQPPPPAVLLERNLTFADKIKESTDVVDSASSSSSSAETDENDFSDQDEVSLKLPPIPSPPKKQRLRSPRTTQVFHDDAVQLRLKGLESNLKNIIQASKISKEEAFASDVQTGKVTYIAAEISHMGALYSGPVNAFGLPDGVGALDYRKAGDGRGRLTAERRAYYLGTLVAGKRQGFGLLRWMDRTEYCGSWHADTPDGSGVETYEDGSWYAGGFKADKRHGMGGIWAADGLIYMGQWQNGVRHGSGVISHADSVKIDLKGKGQTEEVKLTMDMVDMKMNAVYNPLSRCAAEMKSQVVSSIFNLRFSRKAPSTAHPIFIAEFDRGVRRRSIFFSSRVIEHQDLLNDAMSAVDAGQAVGIEALEFSREGWLVLQQGVSSNVLRERRNKQKKLMQFQEEAKELIEILHEEVKIESKDEREVDDDGLLIDSLEVQQLHATQLPPKKLMLCLKVIRARDLKAMDFGGTSDPYVKIALGDQKFRSSIVKKSLNPEWEEFFEMKVLDWAVPLKLSVWDEDAMSADDIIGDCGIWLEDIFEDMRRDGTKDLHSRAQLRITIIRARNLIAADSGGTSDPYVRMHVGGKNSSGQKTTVKNKTLNPVWNETFEFDIGSDERKEVLTIECFDKDIIGSDDSLGKFFIELASLTLQDSPGVPVSEWRSFEKKRRVVNKGQIELQYELIRSDSRPKTAESEKIKSAQEIVNLQARCDDLEKKLLDIKSEASLLWKKLPQKQQGESTDLKLLKLVEQAELKKELEENKRKIVEIHKNSVRKHVNWFLLERDGKVRGKIQLGFSFLELGECTTCVDLRVDRSHRVTAVAGHSCNPSWEKESFRIEVDSDWSRLRCTVLHKEFSEKIKRVLVITVYRARKLKAMDTGFLQGASSDPYVIIKVGDEKRKTSIVSKSLKPVWEETFQIPIWGEPEEPMHVSVWDYDAMSADDVIGEVRIPVSSWGWDRTPIRRWFDITEEGENTGELELGLQIHNPTVHDAKLAALIKVVAARDLEAMDVGGSSDPYAIIKVGDQERKTGVIQKNLSPVWNQEFVLSVDEIYQPVEVSVWDHDQIGADDKIGVARVFLADLIGKQRTQHWHTLKLNGRVHGEVLLSIFLTEQSIQAMGEYLGEVHLNVRDLGYSGKKQKLSLELNNGQIIEDRAVRRFDILKRVLSTWIWAGVSGNDHRERAHSVLQQWQMIAQYNNLYGKKGIKFQVSDGLRISSYERQGILIAPMQGLISFETRAFSSLAQHGATLLNPNRLPLSEKAIQRAAALKKYNGNLLELQRVLPSLLKELGDAQVDEAKARQEKNKAQSIADRLRQEADDQDHHGERLMQEALARGGLSPFDVEYAQWQIDQQRRRTLLHDAETLLSIKTCIWEAADVTMQEIVVKVKHTERDESYLLGHNPVDILDADMGSQEAAIGVLQVTVVCAQRIQMPGSLFNDIPRWVKLSIGEEMFETSSQKADPSLFWNEAVRMYVKKGAHHLKAEILCKTPAVDRSDEAATLVITVLRARNLIAADSGGTSDPYFRLHVGNIEKECQKTKILKKTLNPEFNETFKFRISGSQRRALFNLDCFDYDMLSADDSLGTCAFALEDLVFQQEYTAWLKLDGGESENKGEVELRYTLFPDLPPAKLEISVLRAKDLIAADRGGTSDPYVRVHIGNTAGISKRTKVIKKTLNPEWCQTFNFYISAENRRESVTLECFDYDMVGADDSLGKFEIPLDSLVLEQEYLEWRKLDEDGDENNNGQVEIRYRLLPDTQGLDGITSLGSCCIALRELQEGVESLKWWKVGNSGASRGTLLVQVMEAKDLNANIGKPSCRVWLRLGKYSVKTLMSHNTANPKWTGEPFAFDLIDTVQKLTIDVLRSPSDSGEEEFLGKAFIKISDMLCVIQSKGVFDEWLQLQERFDNTADIVSGAVRIRVTFDPASSPSWGQMKLCLNYEHLKRVLPEQPSNPEEEKIMRLIAAAIDDGNVDEDEQREIEQAELQLAKIRAEKSTLKIPKCGSAQVTLYEIRHSFISHVHAIRTLIEVDKKTAAQTQLTRDLSEAVWDDIFVVDVPLYSQFVKAAVVGQNMVLCLQVIMGKDLEAMDISGTSDPYVKIKLGKHDHKTRIVYKNLDPEWNEDFEMNIDDMSMPLHVSIWDNDLLGADDLIGEIAIRLDELMDSNSDKVQGSLTDWFTVKRSKKATGEILLGFSFKAPDNESRETEKELGSTTIDLSRMTVGEEQIGWHRLTQGQEHFTLSVAALQASALMPIDGVTADPFLKFSVGKQSFVTRHVKQNVNPVWEDERYTFRVKSLNQVLRCEVFDHNSYSSHVFLGEYWINMKDLVLDEEYDEWHNLCLKPNQRDVVAQRHRDGEGLGEIRLKMCLRKTNIPACELKMGVKLLRAPTFKRPHRNERIIHHRTLRGIGSLELSVVSASKMQGHENCRPWVEVSVGDQFEVIKIVRGDDHPCWDTPFALPVAPGAKTLSCKILSMGPKKRKYMLGETTIFLDPLKGAGEVDAWYRLDGRTRLGQLILRVVSAENLLAADSNGKSDPFVQVTFGKLKKKTKTKYKTLDPVWGEEFAFDIFSIKDKIEIEVFDWDAIGNNDLLGRKTINLTDYFVNRKDGKGPGEGRFKISERLKLEGLNGTMFVDTEQSERVQGSIKVEISYHGDPSLLEKVGFLRLVTNYICPAKSVKEAAEMEMALVEGGADHEGYDPWDETHFDAVENELEKVLGPAPKACLSKAKLSSCLGNLELSDNSLQAQISVFKSRGGQVATAKQLASVRSRLATQQVPTPYFNNTDNPMNERIVLGRGMSKPKPPIAPPK